MADNGTILVENKPWKSLEFTIEILENKILHLEGVLTENKPYTLTIAIIKDLIRELKEKQ